MIHFSVLIVVYTELYLSQSGVYTDQPTKIAEVDSLQKFASEPFFCTFVDTISLKRWTQNILHKKN